MNKSMNKLVLLVLGMFSVSIPLVSADHGQHFHPSSLFLDFVLILIAAVTVYYSFNVLQGKIGRGLKIAAIGLAILGIFHLLESLLFLTDLTVGLNEISHRILGIIAFTFVAYGLYTIRLAIKSETKT